MSFLKITDPAKRDLIVTEFLKTKKNIQQNFLNEKLGDIGLQQELTKFYKPIVDSQSTISKEQNALLSTIKENSAATSNALQALLASISSSIKAIQYPQYRSIEEQEEQEEQDKVLSETARTLNLGKIASKYALSYASNKIPFRIYFNDQTREFSIRDTVVNIQDDDIKVGNKTYVGTPGLWALLTLEKPTNFNVNDLNNYGEIMWTTRAMEHPDNPNKVLSSRGYKYKNIIKPIWEMYAKNITPNWDKLLGRKKGEAGEETVGEGVVVLPQDPNALVEMLSLRLASFQAGNTGVRNEIVGICDELLRQGVIDTDSYKNSMLQL